MKRHSTTVKFSDVLLNNIFLFSLSISNYKGSTSNLSQNLILLSETRQPNGEGFTTLIRRYQAVISLSINVEKLGTVMADRKKTFEIRKVYE